MGWVEARLRGQKVLARANADGSLQSEGGRVEIRYRAADARAYRAGERNLEVPAGASVLPDDHCVPAEAGDEKAAKAKSDGAAAPRSGRARAGMPTKLDAAKNGVAPVPEGSWVAYCDGACSGNPGPAGLGLVVVAPDGSVAAEGYEYLGSATNNVGELTAILRVLEAVPNDGKPLYVHTDSQYSIGVLSKGWKAKANGELVARVKEALGARPKTTLVYVPGHVGVTLNERADELAREAVSRRATKLPPGTSA